jgi:hypothetical protein
MVGAPAVARGPRPVPSPKVAKAAKPKQIRPLPDLIRSHRGQVLKAVRRAGGQLVLHRGRQVKLLINGAGKLIYQKVKPSGEKVITKPRRVLWWSHFRARRLGEVDDVQLQARFQRLVYRERKEQKAREARPARRMVALLPDGQEVEPHLMSVVYHGTTKVSPEVALRRGLPAGGNDWRLKEHAEPDGPRNPDSAFRGATLVVADPVSQNGAAYWAGTGGWVYKIRHIPGWDINASLFGRIAKPGGFRSNLMTAEQEIAIPARVPPQRIEAYGRVVEDGQGRLSVREWIPNPAFVPASV